MKYLNLTVRPFCIDLPKQQALKPLEEAAEVYAAWQAYDLMPLSVTKYNLMYECCDTIQAAVNVMYMLGASSRDVQDVMDDVREHNEDRGRYGKGGVDID